MDYCINKLIKTKMYTEELKYKIWNLGGKTT